jgi:peptidyl-prolyl cis-trans isomerase SurA
MKVYPQVEQRSFNDAKGLVMNDYQTILEEEWIKELRKKYPVTVDQKVLNQIAK